MHIAIFCQVIDNYGDIGVCWRLARQWVAEQSSMAPALRVTLWVDDLLSFRKICAAIDPAQSQQFIEGVLVRAWQEAELGDCDVVIEAFGCHLPPQLDAAMRLNKPKWINLEYLSAEAWVETCHRGPSPQVPGLTKYFFFPGFTARTGGLLAERDLQARRKAWLADEGAQANFWQQLGWTARPQALVVSLFCYAEAPLAGLFDLWQQPAPPQQQQPPNPPPTSSPQPPPPYQSANGVLCLVPQGIAQKAVADFFAVPEAGLTPGVRLSRGALTVQIIAFVDQPAYDHLLWQCDLNIVRGEDSFVRAQWAARPFLWHIYPQQDEVHIEKLQAFLARYGDGLPAETQATLQALSLAWNRGEPDAVALNWPAWAAQQAQWREQAHKWVADLAQNGNLADNLLQFMQKID